MINSNKFSIWLVSRSKIFNIFSGFLSLTAVKNHDKVIVNDGGYPVGYCYDRAPACFFSDTPLNHIVCCCVHRCRGLIQDQYFPPLQQHPSKTYKLPLSHAPVLSVFRNCASSQSFRNNLFQQFLTTQWKKNNFCVFAGEGKIFYFPYLAYQEAFDPFLLYQRDDICP